MCYSQMKSHTHTHTAVRPTHTHNAFRFVVVNTTKLSRAPLFRCCTRQEEHQLIVITGLSGEIRAENSSRPTSTDPIIVFFFLILLSSFFQEKDLRPGDNTTPTTPPGATLSLTHHVQSVIIKIFFPFLIFEFIKITKQLKIKWGILGLFLG